MRSDPEGLLETVLHLEMRPKRASNVLCSLLKNSLSLELVLVPKGTRGLAQRLPWEAGSIGPHPILALTFCVAVSLLSILGLNFLNPKKIPFIPVYI